MTHKNQISTTIITIILTALIAGGGVYIWQNQTPAVSETASEASAEQQNTEENNDVVEEDESVQDAEDQEVAKSIAPNEDETVATPLGVQNQNSESVEIKLTPALKREAELIMNFEGEERYQIPAINGTTISMVELNSMLSRDPLYLQYFNQDQYGPSAGYADGGEAVLAKYGQTPREIIRHDEILPLLKETVTNHDFEEFLRAFNINLSNKIIAYQDFDGDRLVVKGCTQGDCSGLRATAIYTTAFSDNFSEPGKVYSTEPKPMVFVVYQLGNKLWFYNLDGETRADMRNEILTYHFNNYSYDGLRMKLVN